MWRAREQEWELKEVRRTGKGNRRQTTRSNTGGRRENENWKKLQANKRKKVLYEKKG